MDLICVTCEPGCCSQAVTVHVTHVHDGTLHDIGKLSQVHDMTMTDDDGDLMT